MEYSGLEFGIYFSAVKAELKEGSMVPGSWEVFGLSVVREGRLSKGR